MLPPSSKAPQSLLGIFLKFIQKPSFFEYPQARQRIRRTLGDILRLYSLKVAMLIPLMILIFMVKKVLGADNDPIGEFIKTTPILPLLAITVIVGPLLEEVVFRLPLRFSSFNISLPLAFFIFGIDLGNVGIRFCLAIIIGLLVRYWIHHRVKKSTGDVFYKNHLRWIVYFSSITFGLIHIFNFDPKTYFIAPLVVLPQILAGLYLSFIRLRYGFWWAVFSHSFHNFCVLIPAILYKLHSHINEKELFTQNSNILLEPQNVLALIYWAYLIGGILLCLGSVAQIIREWHSERKIMSEYLAESG